MNKGFYILLFDIANTASGISIDLSDVAIDVVLSMDGVI